MSAETPSTLRRRWPLVSGIVAVAVAALLGIIVAARRDDLPFEIDTEWMAEVMEARTIWLEAPALLMDWLGGGWVGVIVVPLGIVVLLIVKRQKWGALFYATAALLSVGAVQLVKALVGRPRPEDILVVSDVGSFPSGHVANAATMAVVLAIILNRTWVWFAGIAYIVLMALSRTYLGAHWLSDTIGGALIGAGVAVIVWAPFAHRVGRERSSSQRATVR